MEHINILIILIIICLISALFLYRKLSNRKKKNIEIDELFTKEEIENANE